MSGMRGLRVGIVVVLVALGLAGVARGSSSASTPACRTTNLKVYLGGGDGGAAGSVYVGLNFINKGASACTLGGFPGVSFVDAHHHQVGAAASRTTPPQAKTITLKPQARASVVLRITETGNYPKSTCRAVAARGLRVYPPGERRSAFVVDHTSVCSSARTRQLSVTAIQLGAPS
jgi:hypothetical protein